MDIFTGGLGIVCIAFILMLVALILVALLDCDNLITAIFTVSIFLIIFGFVIVIVGACIKTFSNKFEVVATAPLRAKDDNVIYYIDPKTEEEVEVKIEKDTKISATTKPSYVEFSETKWLFFTVNNTVYYINIEEQ